MPSDSPGVHSGALPMYTRASLGFSVLHGIANSKSTDCYLIIKADTMGIIAPQLFNYTLTFLL